MLISILTFIKAFRRDDGMENQIFIGIIAVCVVLIIAALIRRKPGLIIDFCLRTCLGTAGIYILNLLFSNIGYDIHVGINAATLLTNGLLGLPGFLLLYSLAVFYTFRT
jgi:pro-sigmaK processing inhibitor BofA